MTFSLTKDFKTADELASQTQAILEQVRSTGQPVAITMDGKPAVVLLEASRFEWMVHLLNLSRMLNEAEAEVRAGKTRPVEEFFEELLSERDGAKKVSGRNRSRRRA
jgi:prevent-host-death family protein